MFKKALYGLILIMLVFIGGCTINATSHYIIVRGECSDSSFNYTYETNGFDNCTNSILDDGFSIHCYGVLV